GCVAHDPPSTTLCFPSKKSAVYPGYSAMGSNPSHDSSTLLVHSHTPPSSAWPAGRPRPAAPRPFPRPYPVTGIGCQWRKPTLAPSRLLNSACGAAREVGSSSSSSLSSSSSVAVASEAGADAGGVAGGEIS